ncbi:MAG: PepSY domain-containing protein, partial [Blastocatellia bacterium]|nr:PepSY domain-containing protein [Blastocatellia bacterium]
MSTTIGLSSKQVLRSLHSWVGLAAGAFLVIIGLAGSIIVFRSELERAAIPKGAASTTNNQLVNLDMVAGEIKNLRPDGHIRRVRLPSGSEP